MTLSASGVNDNWTILGSSLTSKVLMPFLLKKFSIFLDYTPQLSDLSATEALRLCQLNGVKPKLSITFSLVNMNMCRFTALPAEKEEAITFDPQ